MYADQGNGFVWTKNSKFIGTTGQGGSPKLQVTPYGRALGFNTTHGTGTTDRILQQPITVPQSYFSLVHWDYHIGLGGGNLGRVFQLNGDNGTSFGAWAATGSEMGISRIGSMATCQWTLGGAITQNAWQCYGVSLDQPNLQPPLLYRNGVLGSTTHIQNWAGAATAVSGTVERGNRGTDSARCFDGMLGPLWMFDHPSSYLTAAEHKYLSQGGFGAIYVAPSFRLWLASGVAAGIFGPLVHGRLHGKGALVGGRLHV